MKKKNYRLLSLLFVLPLLLTGCGGKGGSSQQGGGGGGGTTEPAGPAVTGVSIQKPADLVVLDGTRATLKATVAGEEGVSQKVKWSSSDSQIATVTNGVVNFLKVAEQKKVTITATSDANAQFADSVEFTVEHSPFDLKNSRGNPDTSCYLEDGTFIVEDPQDVALVYADVHDTRWYVEATITIDSLDKSDAYPKFGIMASDRDDGMWCYENSHQFFYYVDSYSSATSWVNMNVVPEKDTLEDWNWAGNISPAVASPAVALGTPFKMGLMRDGNKFYQFYGRASDLTLNLVGTFEYNSFGENANYVWVGGWKAAVTVEEPKCMVGDAINSLYVVPEGLSLKSEGETVYLGNSVQIEVTTEGLWDRNKLTFTSDNPEIATVNEKGVVTANETTAGVAHITVALTGTELSATYTLTVTDDLMFKVVLDGKMDDLIWTAAVKTNRYMLKANANNLVYIYGATNSRGVYFFMEYTVSQLKTEGGGWWQQDNVEFRLGDNDKVWSRQYWLSVMNGGSFVSVGSGEKPEEIFYEPIALGNDNLYHCVFEMFVPFGDDNCTKGETLYAAFGFNPAAGWKAGHGFNGDGTPVANDALYVTADGFKHGEACCTDGHEYGPWIVDVPATCAATGHRYRECGWCGHHDEEVLPIDENAHQFDYEHAVVTTPSTCSTHGVGTATCTICGATDNTELPFDYSNHSDTDYPATHTYCHGCGVGSHLANAAGDAYDHNFGGWDNKATWTDLGVWEGDFVAQINFHMEGCQGMNASSAPGDCCWRTVLPILYAEDYATTHGDAVFRMDWWGWSDGGFTTELNKGACPAGFNWETNYQGFSNMDVELTITKVGTNVTLAWVWKCCATEGPYLNQVYNYNQSCILTNGAKMGVALTAEFTIYTVTTATITRP